MLLAASFQDLVATGPQTGIQNELGIVSGKGAWTGTLNNGNRSTDTCGDWVSNAASGLTGDPDQPASWSADPPSVTCTETGTIICVER